ncbi:MAG TPA: hypothetical protein VMH77_03430, partial [Steroidobacteraceae bacterium]|nr:hypothetical protein [Steroidobacteraceae bacterium]
MRRSGRSPARTLGAVASLLIASLLLSGSAAAQTQTPSLTDEQLQIFQSLSPEQQQAVLERLSSGDSAGDAVTGQ